MPVNFIKHLYYRILNCEISYHKLPVDSNFACFICSFIFNQNKIIDAVLYISVSFFTSEGGKTLSVFCKFILKAFTWSNIINRGTFYSSPLLHNFPYYGLIIMHGESMYFCISPYFTYVRRIVYHEDRHVFYNHNITS